MKHIFYEGENKGESLTLTCMLTFLLQLPRFLILRYTIITFTPVYTQ